MKIHIVEKNSHYIKKSKSRVLGLGSLLSLSGWSSYFVCFLFVEK